MPDETDFLVHARQASGESAPTRRKIRLEQAHATYTGLRSTLVKENPPRQARTPDSWHRSQTKNGTFAATPRLVGRRYRRRHIPTPTPTPTRCCCGSQRVLDNRPLRRRCVNARHTRLRAETKRRTSVVLQRWYAARVRRRASRATRSHRVAQTNGALRL